MLIVIAAVTGAVTIFQNPSTVIEWLGGVTKAEFAKAISDIKQEIAQITLSKDEVKKLR